MSDLFARTELGERYAKALFALALDEKSQDAVARDVVQLGLALAASADLRRLITLPGLEASEKLKGFIGLAEALNFQAVTKKTVGVLAQNGRLEAIYGFIGAYKSIYEAHQGLVSAVVTTAVPMSATQEKALKAALKKALGREPDIKTEVVPEILGGLKIKLGSRLFDAALSTKLDTLKFALKRA